MNWLAFARKFLAEERGSGSAFMIGMLPATLALAGLAIDGSAVFQQQGRLQATADAAALAAAADLPDVDTAAQDAILYAQKNMPVDANGNVLAEADVVTGNWNVDDHVFTQSGTPVNAIKVVVRQTAQNHNPYPTSFLNLVGIGDWDITAQATATTSQPKLWVALVLDNSSSMSEGGKTTKLAALKTASQRLLAQLRNASSKPGDVQVSIVAFTKNAKLGTSYVNASWLDWSDFDAAPPVAAPGSSVGPGSNCPFNSNGIACQSSSANGSSTVSTIPSSGQICPTANSYGHYYNGCYDSKCSGGYCLTGKGNKSSSTYTHTWTPNAHGTWTGCVMDRDQDYDITNDLPSTGGTMVWPENTTYCDPNKSTAPLPAITPLTPLDTDAELTALDNQVTALTANGFTNQAIGLDWGWLAMTPGMPLNPVTPDLPQETQRIIILLSDGFNTYDRWTPSPSAMTEDKAYSDQRMIPTTAGKTGVCANAKADGITIYTVYVNTGGGEGNSTILQECATNASMYYGPLTSSDEIITTFDSIGRRIGRLRLVQ